MRASGLKGKARLLAVATALCALLALSGCSGVSVDSMKADAQEALDDLAAVEAEHTRPPSVLVTAQNNRAFAAALASSDPDGVAVRDFVDRYRGRTVEFDATLSAVSDDREVPGERTHNDLELVAGDSAQRTAGPVFTLRAINVSKTGLGGAQVGQKVDVIATVQSIDPDTSQVVLGLVSIRDRS